jgi:monofunctional biosynthetic peptidoglycan transglycosylase
VLWPLTIIFGYWLIALVAYRFLNPPLTPLMVIRSIDNRAWVQYHPAYLETINPVLLRTIIASEDSRFCLHHGIDFDAVGDALEDYENRGRMRGASTITMQVARNVFLWNGGGIVRKILEAPLALLLDAAWPKRRIIEVYLNIAEWGDGVFGAEAATQINFHKPARQLTTAEASRLTAVLPNPIRWSPARPTAYIQQRANIIQHRVGQLNAAQVQCLNAHR